MSKFADLEISSTGDLVLSKRDISSNKLKLSFFHAYSKAIKLQFNLENFSTHNFDGINLSFNLKSKNYVAACNIVEDLELVKQTILLKLKTIIGELPNRQDFGSNLIYFKHKQVSDTLLTKLKIMIQQELSTIIQNPIINISTFCKSNGKYKEGLSISIYSEDEHILDYKIF